MRILIIGNLGYVGSNLVNYLARKYPHSEIIGYDTGFFSHIKSISDYDPEIRITNQIFGDVRSFPKKLIRNIDTVIYLAAISNDPMGNEFESATSQINHLSCINIAKLAIEANVKSFVFASSCSVYGYAEDGMRTEESDLNPLTAYAKSKINTEIDLKKLESKNCKITCLRFATACGYSPRLRLDLVLNDFVATAIQDGKIEILSNGMPWRPLIHINDMARAIDWAINRDIVNHNHFLTINVGSNSWNYRVKDLAEGVKKVFGDIEVNINKLASTDNRSYKVDFSMYNDLANGYLPKYGLIEAIKDLKEGILKSNFNLKDFRNSKLMRLNVLKNHLKHSRLNKDLYWEI